MCDLNNCSGEIKELQSLVEKFCKDRDWDQFHNPKDLAIGLSTESNELLDIFRFKSFDQMQFMMKDEKTRNHISEELGDIYFFLLRFAKMYDFDLHVCLTSKLAKNNKKYPKDKVKGKNLKYTEY